MNWSFPGVPGPPARSADMPPRHDALQARLATVLAAPPSVMRPRTGPGSPSWTPWPSCGPCAQRPRPSAAASRPFHRSPQQQPSLDEHHLGTERCTGNSLSSVSRHEPTSGLGADTGRQPGWRDCMITNRGKCGIRMRMTVTPGCGGDRHRVGVVRRCPTLPRGLPRSTIGAVGLSFRVRNGTGRFPDAMAAGTLWRCRSVVGRPYLGNRTVDAEHSVSVWASCRLISTGQLHVLPRFHVRPINPVV